MNAAGPIQKAAVYQHSLSDLLRRTAGRVPHKLAIRCGETTWSYAEFDRICTRLAAGLWAQGIHPGDRVAILSRNSHAFAAMRFALARIGAVLVPINFMLNAEEIAFILQNSGTTALAIGPDFLENGLAAARASKIATLLWLPGEKPASPPSGLTSFERSDPDGRTDTGGRSRRAHVGADRLHQRHRVAAERRDAHPRGGHLAVRELYHRR